MNVQLSFCPINCNRCYVIVVLASLLIFFPLENSDRMAIFHILNIIMLWPFSIERLLASVCLENNFLCLCVYVGSKR